MATPEILFLVIALKMAVANPQEFQTDSQDRQLAKTIVDALQDPNFEDEVVFDLKKENQVYLNRTTSLVIKYIVKREVDKYRPRRTEAVSRRVYSALVMKLIDIARDLPRNTSSADRIDAAHRYYVSVESKDMHDQMADKQVFHVFARLYDVLFTAPRILAQLGKLEDLTPKTLLLKLRAMETKPVHLAVALLVQFHLRSTVNFAIRTKAIEVLATKPERVGSEVINTLKALAVRLLPVVDLLDLHLSHASPAFKDTSPATWLGIVNDKQP